MRAGRDIICWPANEFFDHSGNFRASPEQFARFVFSICAGLDTRFVRTPTHRSPDKRMMALSQFQSLPWVSSLTLSIKGCSGSDHNSHVLTRSTDMLGLLLPLFLMCTIPTTLTYL